LTCLLGYKQFGWISGMSDERITHLEVVGKPGEGSGAAVSSVAYKGSAVPTKVHDDDLVMSLVDMALTCPADKREACVRSACEGDPELFDQVWMYVQWEQRMNGFLLDPVYSPDSNEHLLKPGDLLANRFRIVRKIAEGGMGIVYETTDEKLQRRIAIKIAKVGFSKRLAPEVRNATEISHPNICKIFEIHTAPTGGGEIDFLTMELAEGETLAYRLQRGPLPAALALTIAQQLCMGLAEAHRNHVIHGDLKSNNIILAGATDGAIRVVITDFGLASRPEGSRQSPQTGDVGGVPDYMAPELWEGKQPSVASDIYSLGVLLCELFWGRRPREFRLSLQKPFARKLPVLNSKWRRIVVRCLHPVPANRFRSVDEIAQALAAPRQYRSILQVAAAMVLAILTGLMTYQRAIALKESGRLAVIPFVNARGTPENEYLCDRISEGLINDLVQSSDLRVIARSSSFRFKGDSVDVKRAAQALGAQVLMTGRVDEMNGWLRITVELVNGSDGIQIWGSQYSSTISDLTELQAEISRQVAERISSKLNRSVAKSPFTIERMRNLHLGAALSAPESIEQCLADVR
jgi:serine/threonine protein kinase